MGFFAPYGLPGFIETAGLNIFQSKAFAHVHRPAVTLATVFEGTTGRPLGPAEYETHLARLYRLASVINQFVGRFALFRKIEIHT